MSLNEHAAPGLSAAISFQYERALYWLAKSPEGFVVGIETDDDVAVRGSDGSQTLEQDKHSIQTEGNPFADRSKNLWNTLATWIEALDTHEVSPETTRFLMVTNKTLPNCLARRIGLARTEAEALKCVDELVAEAQMPSETIKTLMARVTRQNSRSNLLRLVLHCEAVDSNSVADAVSQRMQTISYLHIPASLHDQAESIAQELLGWIHTAAYAAWTAGVAAWITRSHFTNALDAIVGNRQRRIRRERAENLVPIASDGVTGQLGSTYVKQVGLVTEDDSILESAINDFLRCCVEKLRLSGEGSVTDDDWLEFESTLKSRWTRIRDRCRRIEAGKPEEDIGFAVLDETTHHRERLAGSETEQVYLTSGTYHRLADSLAVGWHPRYETLLTNNNRAQS